jgi:N-carbamoylputrescine amidase
MVARVAIAQVSCEYGKPSSNLQRVQDAIKQAARQRADLVCFPETVAVGWINPDAHKLAQPIPGRFTNRVAAAARRYHIYVCIGLTEKTTKGTFDSAVLIGRGGEILIHHRKINTLAGFLSPPYLKGATSGIRCIDTDLGRLGILVCSDTLDAGVLAAMKARAPDVVLVPYGWLAPNGDGNPYTEYTLADTVRYAAQSMKTWVVGVNGLGSIAGGPLNGFRFNGRSVVASPKGNIKREAEERPQVITIEITH